MSKHSLMCVVLLFCFVISSCIAARHPFVKEMAMPIENMYRKGGEVKGIELEESCEGAKNNEDCLMRRTLAAHLDYIYTQNKKP